jgi:hypothetical protein
MPVATIKSIVKICNALIFLKLAANYNHKLHSTCLDLMNRMILVIGDFHGVPLNNRNILYQIICKNS